MQMSWHRGLQAPGKPVFEAIVQRWGSSVLASNGFLERSAIASIVFQDRNELAALNSIVHPFVGSRIADIRSEIRLSQPDAVVVIDVPLLIRPGGVLCRSEYENLTKIVVVDTIPEIAANRLMMSRGLSKDDIKARVVSQATRVDRLAMADFVIDNNGSLEELIAQVRKCWSWMLSLR